MNFTTYKVQLTSKIQLTEMDFSTPYIYTSYSQENFLKTKRLSNDVKHTYIQRFIMAFGDSKMLDSEIFDPQGTSAV